MQSNGAEIIHTFGKNKRSYGFRRIVRAASKCSNLRLHADPSSDLVTITRDETRPLQGQSPHLASLSLVYRHDRRGWRARLTAVYTGKRIYSTSGWYGLDYWQKGYSFLDASFEKKFGKHIKVFVEANNTFNTITSVDLLVPNPEFVSAFIPGQKSPGRFTVMRQVVDKATYYAELEWGLP